MLLLSIFTPWLLLASGALSSTVNKPVVTDREKFSIEIHGQDVMLLGGSIASYNAPIKCGVTNLNSEY